MAGMARVRLDPRALSRVRGGCRGARQHHAAVPCSFPRAGGWSQKAFARRRSAAALFRGGDRRSGRGKCSRRRLLLRGGNILLPVASSFTIRRLLLRGREYHSERCGQHARLFLREGAEAKQWQDRRILYSRAENLDISGEIFAKCTFRQRFFGSKRTKYAYFAKMGCPGVHFSEILPESCSLAALEYIWRRFRHVPAFARGLLIGANRVWPCRTCFRVPLGVRLSHRI